MLARLQNAARLRLAQVSSLDSTATAKLDNERDDALFALAVLAWCRRVGCGSVEVHARMVCLLSTRHARVTLSQVVDEHFSSYIVRIYHRRRFAQLQSVTSRTAVQLFVALWRLC